ncbi:uncharacterized protein BXZ73DRAFT_85663 [Epithele typhae]|uniref:uncharacterized protein n=1 Tax=Epithele typhae TaxID=378194 RepID=UPI0020077CA1|nr:uncharacterized protein BXZ73DRAFT_85663 [Epithele typhae]KAH9900661.1 hypothetical protein BXZ73DRAFT_85663 [Epithele typhae]
MGDRPKRRLPSIEIPSTTSTLNTSELNVHVHAGGNFYNIQPGAVLNIDGSARSVEHFPAAERRARPRRGGSACEDHDPDPPSLSKDARIPLSMYEDGAAVESAQSKGSKDLNRHLHHFDGPDPLHRGLWYLVTAGRRVGVFKFWDEAAEQVIGVPDNCYKSYRSRDEAVERYRVAEQEGRVRPL